MQPYINKPFFQNSRNGARFPSLTTWCKMGPGFYHW